MKKKFRRSRIILNWEEKETKERKRKGRNERE